MDTDIDVSGADVLAVVLCTEPGRNVEVDSPTAKQTDWRFRCFKYRLERLCGEFGDL
jgi:hypothetical protein